MATVNGVNAASSLTVLTDVPTTTNADIGFGTTSGGPKVNGIANLQSQKNAVLTELSEIDFNASSDDPNAPNPMVQLFVAQTKFNAIDKTEQAIFKAEETDQERYRQAIDGIKIR